MIVKNKYFYSLRKEWEDYIVQTNPKISYLWNTLKLSCQNDSYFRILWSEEGNKKQSFNYLLLEAGKRKRKYRRLIVCSLKKCTNHADLSSGYESQDMALKLANANNCSFFNKWIEFSCISSAKNLWIKTWCIIL